MRILWLCAFFIFLALPALTLPALAVTPGEALKDPVAEARAREISHNIRCLVCAGEAIDESGAALARDLRLLIRARITAGDSDAEIYRYLTDRYGDDILMSPPFAPRTAVLWALPLLMVLGGLAFLWRQFFAAAEDT